MTSAGILLIVALVSADAPKVEVADRLREAARMAGCAEATVEIHAEPGAGAYLIQVRCRTWILAPSSGPGGHP